MQFRFLSPVRFHVLPMSTRFPFKYGIASMSRLPHLFAIADLEVDGKPAQGLASEGLPPKWFTKDPNTPFEQDLAEMLSVIQNAARLSRASAGSSTTYFPWWQSLYDEQHRWAALKQLPPLLTNLGVSLMERLVLDGLCKAAGQPLHSLLHTNALGIDLGAVRGELAGWDTSRVVDATPLQSVLARHTVGLGDPLRAADLTPRERLNDGLPFALDESIRAYGLRRFKIKVCGKAETDLPRLREITSVITTECRDGFKATLDGNEQFQDLASFRAFYDELSGDAAVKPLFDNLILIEQPLHRSKALDEAVLPVLSAWRDGPAMIIDESDGTLGDLPRALELGYAGTSHKNCKGIVKGLANAALLRRQAALEPDREWLLSGEDLANVGPVALLQDLAMMAALGISHVERNGHHYFRGLSMYSEDVQSAVLEAHDGLYGRHPNGFAALDIREGRLDLTSVNHAPFGCGASLDASRFESLDAWIQRGGMTEL